MAEYDPITGDPLLHLGPDDDVVYDHGRDEWVAARPPVELPRSKEHEGCNYLAVLIEHEDGPWYFCNKCGFGEDATDG